MSDYPETFEKAKKLVTKDPLPDDIFDQLHELRDRTPIEFHEQFKAFFSSAALRSDDV